MQKTEVFPRAVSGDAVYITMNENAKGTPMALSGHMDTVHAVGSFGSPAVRKGGKIRSLDEYALLPSLRDAAKRPAAAVIGL